MLYLTALKLVWTVFKEHLKYHDIFWKVGTQLIATFDIFMPEIQDSIIYIFWSIFPIISNNPPQLHFGDPTFQHKGQSASARGRGQAIHIDDNLWEGWWLNPVMIKGGRREWIPSQWLFIWIQHPIHSKSVDFHQIHGPVLFTIESRVFFLMFYSTVIYHCRIKHEKKYWEILRIHCTLVQHNMILITTV